MTSASSAYLSTPSDAVVHSSGWYRIGSVEITRLPLVEASPDGKRFARLGARLASARLAQLGARLPTVAEQMVMFALARHIEPVVLPTSSMVLMAGLRSNDQVGIQRFRETHMMTLEWCDVHDSAVWAALADWSGDVPVDNAGKHWAQPDAQTPPNHSLIVGWRTPFARRYGVNNDVMIQTPSSFHDDVQDDYATTFHGVREVQ